MNLPTNSIVTKTISLPNLKVNLELIIYETNILKLINYIIKF